MNELIFERTLKPMHLAHIDSILAMGTGSFIYATRTWSLYLNQGLSFRSMLYLEVYAASLLKEFLEKIDQSRVGNRDVWSR